MEENEMLRKIEKFFQYNLKIKNLLYEIAPSEEDGYNYSSINEYLERLLKAMEQIKYLLLNLLDELNEKDAKIHIENNFKKYEERIQGRVNNYEDLRKIYHECCSSMSNELINKVKKSFIGYYIFYGSLNTLMKECMTINEMLHVLHSAIVNNEEYYKSMPQISRKRNYEGYPIILYGRENDLSWELFNNYPIEMSCGDTDILSLEKDILIMVRDKGHALSIKIEIEENEITIRYYIPKICNKKMVRALRGINEINKYDTFATGSFVTTKENFSTDIIKLINGVPMDVDFVFDDWEEEDIITVDGTSNCTKKR